MKRRPYLMKAPNLFLAGTLASCLVLSSSSYAVTIGWWRMGDSDGSLPSAPVNDGDGVINETLSAVGDNAMVRMTPDPTGGALLQYSTDVPAPSIYDPIGDTILPNTWSISADAAVRERMLTATEFTVPTSFSYETFVKFDTSAASVDFALQSRSISGGWRIGTQADGSLRALFQGAVAAGTGPQYTLAAPASTALTPGQWYQVGLIFEGNSTDGSDDTHLYLNHQLIASGNLTDTINFGGATPGFNFFTGAALAARQVRLDETRYFDTPLALDGSDFLLPAGVPAPQLVVDRETGAITLKNNAIGQGDFNILGYTITSEFGALDHAGWKSIANNYDSGNPGAIDADGNWTILSDSDSYEDLSEFTFAGNGATIAAGQSVVLSQGGGAWIPTHVEDLAVEFALADGTFLAIPVAYEGNDGETLVRSDFDGDGSITAADYTNHLVANFPMSIADGVSPALRYLQGDINGDGSINSYDFALFRNDFEAANGGGSFLAMLQGVNQVPEPATLALLGMGALGLVALRKRRLLPLRVPALLAIIVVLSAAAPAHAQLISWWRFGDDDPAPVANGLITSSAANPQTNGSSAVDLSFSTAQPFYSTQVPGATIIDPQNYAGSGQKYVNSWSLGTNVATDRERLATVASIVVPTTFTYETFVRFPNVLATGSADFGYHRNNANGGWLLEVNADGTLHAVMQSRDMDVSTTIHSLEISSPLPLTNNQWHHVALVFEGNSSNGADDTHLYVDGQLVGSGNVLDGSIFGEHESAPVFGEVFSTSGATVDEARYHSSVVAPDDFLRVGGLLTTVNSVTGEIRLVNESLSDSIELSSYDISSPLGRLLTGNSDWNSLSDQNLDPVMGGDGAGETWDEGATSNQFAFGETFLLGSTTLAPGASLSLGNAYMEGVVDNDLTVRYVNGSSSARAFVQFVDSSALPGDFNADGTVDAADYVLWRNNLNGNESVLNGNGNGSGVVDAADYTLWKSRFGQTSGGALAVAPAQVPEPANYAILLLAAGGMMIYFTSKRSFAMTTIKVAPLLALAMITLASTSQAVVTLDRHYTMGDFSDGSGHEGATAANGPPGAVVSSSFDPPADVLDSTGPQFADLAQSGGPTYVSLSTGPYTRANRGTGNDYAVHFDGTDSFLTGPALNALSETVTQGMQMWVYADSAKLGQGRQVIVSDSFNAGGPAISANGRWTQNFSDHPNETDIEATVPVVGNTWHHVAQHIWFNSDTAAPDVVPGTGAAEPYTSVLYVNGVAVSASNDASLVPPVTTFQVGAAGATATNFFQGAIDELKVYTSTPNGFDLFTDNEWIAARIAQIPGGTVKEGDINFDGQVNDGDVTAFVAGWRNEKRLNGAHAHVYVADWQTLGWGDLNLDGRVNLRDALQLHSALQANGAAGLDLALFEGASVPEPATMALLSGLTLVGALLLKQRRA